MSHQVIAFNLDCFGPIYHITSPARQGLDQLVSIPLTAQVEKISKRQTRKITMPHCVSVECLVDLVYVWFAYVSTTRSKMKSAVIVEVAQTGDCSKGLLSACVAPSLTGVLY